MFIYYFMVKHFHVLVSDIVLAVNWLYINWLEAWHFAVVKLQSNKRLTLNFIIIAFVIIEKQLFPKANSIVDI